MTTLRSKWARENKARLRAARPLLGRRQGELLHLGDAWAGNQPCPRRDN
jgi:hypothetical protein